MDTIRPVLERITRDLPCELTHADLVRAVVAGGNPVVGGRG